MLTCSICKTRKRGNCECIATCWSQTSHFPLWLRHHAKFEVAEPTRYCRIISFLLLIQYFTLSHWPLTFDLRHLQRIACDVMKLCTKFEHNRAIRGGVIAISVFDLITLNIALSVVLGSGIIFTKFDLQQLTVPVLALLCWYVTSRCDLDLWPVDLESLWYIKRHVIKVLTKFERNQAIRGWVIDNFCTRYVTLWPWPLTSSPWTFTTLWVSCV